ncbi:Uncharacterised protein [Salmonella enterica]|nr:Uncharacterised protein [Salmonella enterica]
MSCVNIHQETGVTLPSDDIDCLEQSMSNLATAIADLFAP